MANPIYPRHQRLDQEQEDDPETTASALMSMDLPKAATVCREHACLMAPIREAGEQLVLQPNSPRSIYYSHGRPASPLPLPPIAEPGGKILL